MKILSEVGPDLSRFAHVKHFCSWLGLCPGTKISGGKVLSAKTKRSANRVRQALKMAAMSLSHSDSALGAFCRRMPGRMDKPRANTATAHELARMVYFMLTRGEAYVDQGQRHHEERQRQRSTAALKRRPPRSASQSCLRRCSHEITPQPVLLLMTCTPQTLQCMTRFLPARLASYMAASASCSRRNGCVASWGASA